MVVGNFGLAMYNMASVEFIFLSDSTALFSDLIIPTEFFAQRYIDTIWSGQRCCSRALCLPFAANPTTWRKSYQETDFRR